MRRLLPATLTLLVAVALLLPATGVSGRRVAQTSARSLLAGGIVAAVNRIRRSHGLRPLRASPELTEAARLHSLDMGEHGYFDHASLGGGAFWRRIERFYPDRGFRLWSVGENLLWVSPGVSSAEAVTLWLRSPKHRRILLDARWREIGLSAVHVVAAPGVFDGLDVTIVTADFGSRLR